MAYIGQRMSERAAMAYEDGEKAFIRDYKRRI